MASQPGQVVCFEAFRREREGRRARVLPYLMPRSAAPQSPFNGIALSEREIAHRHRMLRHLAEEAGTAAGEAPYGRG